jgi:hypothetical protein
MIEKSAKILEDKVLDRLKRKGFEEWTNGVGTVCYTLNGWDIWHVNGHQEDAVVNRKGDDMGYFFNLRTGKVVLDNATDSTTKRFLRYIQAQKFMNEEVGYDA